MFLVRESEKSFEDASRALQSAVDDGGFGVLHVHDLGSILRGKGFDFAEECRVFEVCNPAQAVKVLAGDMKLNAALPCRISVYTESGRTRIGMIRPVPMLAGLSDDPALVPIADEVERSLADMIDAAV